MGGRKDNLYLSGCFPTAVKAKTETERETVKAKNPLGKQKRAEPGNLLHFNFYLDVKHRREKYEKYAFTLHELVHV